MKKFYLTLIVSLFIALAHDLYAYNYILKEIWYSKTMHRHITVLHYTEGIKVQGLNDRMDWVWFEKISHNTYFDMRSNRMKFVGSRLVLKFRNRNSISFTKIKEVVEYHVNSPQAYVQPHMQAQTNFILNTQQLEGTWLVRELNRKIVISPTRDGIKARFIDELNWQTYALLDNSLVAPSGSRYIPQSSTILIWKHHSDQLTLTLEKISNSW